MFVSLMALVVGTAYAQAEAPTSAVPEEVLITDVGWGFTAVYAVHTRDAIVLVDAHRPHHEGRILRRMRARGLDPERVTALVVTHGHPDHAGSTAALAAELHVPVIAGAADAPYLEAGAAPITPTNLAGKLIALTVPHKFPPVATDVPVEGTPPGWDDAGFDLAPYGVPGTVHQVGGHTPGSVTVELPGGRAIVGDLVRTGLARHHVPARHFFQDDEVGAIEALAGVLDRGNTVVYPIHRGSVPAEALAPFVDGQAEDARERALSASTR